MIWKKDKLKPVQPYLVIDKDNYVQKLSDDENISHFFQFNARGDEWIQAVPDGCADLFFEYTKDGLKAHVCGTNVSYCKEEMFVGSEVFGVRFMPGVVPPFINVKLKDLIGKWCELEQVGTGDFSWLADMGQEDDFLKRIEIFEKAYNAAKSPNRRFVGKEKIVKTVIELINSSDGKIRISDIQDKTGYSERYINKIFNEEMGLSPKTFCKIIKFQRALEYLDYGAPGKMTDASVKLGYYDQSQFIKDFKKYAGITPKRYLDMVEGIRYGELMRQSIL